MIFILSSLANPAAALYATIKDKATRNALAKHFQVTSQKIEEITSTTGFPIKAFGNDKQREPRLLLLIENLRIQDLF